MKIRIRYSFAVQCFLVAFVLFPNLVSIRVGGMPSLTLPRLLLVACYLWILLDLRLQREFLHVIRNNVYNLPIAIFLSVCLYTAILCRDVNSFFGFFVDSVLVYYVLVHALRKCLSIDDLSRLVSICMYVMCIIGVIEFVTGVNVLSLISIGEGSEIASTFRDSTLRVRGPYGHPLGYAMVLLLLFPVSCYSRAERSVSLFRHKALFVLVFMNVMFTGSRSGIGLFCIEVLVICLFTSRKYRSGTILASAASALTLVVCALLFAENSLVQYVLRQLFYVVDQVLGTDIALRYGGDASILNSSIARDRIWKIPFDPSLSPWIGKGVSYQTGAYRVDGWLVTSIDNYYIRTYISYGIFGVIAVLLLFAAFVRANIRRVFDEDKAYVVCLASGLLYAANLVVVDELATLRYFFIVLAISGVVVAEARAQSQVRSPVQSGVHESRAAEKYPVHTEIPR